MLGVRHWFVRSCTRLASVRCLVVSACRHVRWPGTLVFLLVCPPWAVSLFGVVLGRVGPPLVVALLSAAGVPPFPPWRPPWAPGLVAGRAVRAAWLRRLPVPPPLWCGLPARASARAGVPDRRTVGCQL